METITEERLIDALPHGSGIDCNWSAETQKNGNIVASNSYHLMDDGGMYDGWQNFSVKLYRHKADKLNPLKGPCEGQVQVVHRKGDWDYSVHLTGCRVRRNSAYDLRNYLVECIGHALSEAGIVVGMGSEIIDA